MRTMCAALVVCLAGGAVALGAQAPAPAAPRGGQQPAAPRGGQTPEAPAGQSSAQPPARGAAAPPDGYKYDPAGRRDPFTDLLAPGPDRPLVSKPGVEGLAGLSVNDITVRGILQSKGGFIAMVQAPDKKTYLVHQGDKFLDGTVRTVTKEGLVIVQEVRDPLSLVKQREIRKLLRSAEGAKP